MSAAQSAPGLGFGERLPDFLRHTPEGEPRYAYDLADGRPWLLLASRRPDAALVAALHGAAADATLNWVAVLAVGPARLRELVADRPGDIHWLADDGAVSGYLTGGRADSVLLLLDGNQRVLARTEISGADALAAACAALRAQAGALERRAERVVTGGAPALIVPRVFEPALCAELVALYDREGGLPSGSLQMEDGAPRLKVDPRYKSRHDYQRFDAAWTQRLSTLLVRRVLPEVDKCFAFRADSFEAFKLACYEAGDADGSGQAGYHRPHRDNVTPDVEERRFALSVNLNTGDYEGGELRFPEYGPELFLPPVGAAAVFSSSMLHEALPVRRGRRLVLLTFLACAARHGPHLYHEPR